MTVLDAIGVAMALYGIYLTTAAANDERGNFIIAQHLGAVMAATGMGLILL